MVDKFKASEAQEWNSHGHMGRGKVKRKLTTRTLIKGHGVASDRQDSAAEGESRIVERESPPANEPADMRDT